MNNEEKLNFTDYVCPEDTSEMRCPHCSKHIKVPKLSDSVTCGGCSKLWYLVQEWLSV